MRKFFVFLMFCGLGMAFGQQRIAYNGSGNYELVERTDLRRYDNGRYKGLLSREVSSLIIPSASDNGFLYDGTFWVLENTRHNGFDVGMSFDEGVPAKFLICNDGHMDMIVDNGFPSYRSFPTFPEGEISVGDSWEAQAVRAVDPLYKGVVTLMPVMVRYTYSGDSVFNGEEVFVINAGWATRYGMGTGAYFLDFGGDKDLRRAYGSHKARILVSKVSGNSVLISDVVDETFVYGDGNEISFKGTVSLFTKYPPAMDRMKFLPALKRVAGLSDEDVEALKKHVGKWPGDEGAGRETDGGRAGVDDLYNKYNGDDDEEFSIKVDNTPAGVRLTMENLQFLPDSAQFVPGQLEKLDDIADVLKSVPSGIFLIEGHTADTGFPEDEMKLSVRRAEYIAKEFSARGINRSNIICRGAGGTKPVADNKTYAGKAKNRRVEITILD